MTQQNEKPSAKAVEIFPIDGLQLHVGRDGTWLTFSGNGKHATLNMEIFAERQGFSIGKQAILGWCADRQAEAAVLQARKDAIMAEHQRTVDMLLDAEYGAKPNV